MAGGTNNIKRPGYTPGGPGSDKPGGQNAGGWIPPQMVTGGPYGPGADKPGWGAGGPPPPNPAQMEAWKKQFGNWNPGTDKPGQFGGWNPGQGQPGQFPGMNIPGLLAGGGQPGQNMPPGFPAYDNSPENWQDGGYDPNAQQLPPKWYV